MIKEDIKNIKSSRGDLRSFGLIVGGIFVVLGAYGLWRGREWGMVSLFAGGLLVFTGLVLPRCLKWFYKIWMIFGIAMGFVITNILLTLFFYAMLTPLSFLARVFGKKFADIGFRTGGKTYWRRRSSEAADPKNLEHQF